MAEDRAPRAIRIAVLAMGGEGGGVLAEWIVALGESCDHVAQMTSVPGVAQRTGATIYYVELFPRAAIPPGGEPILALMPVPGDVDVVVCSELMEAARAIQRGFVTPDRTTLVASTHRVYAITERIALADGRVDAPALRDACAKAARHLVAFDMAAVAERTGSVISAVMFGALARSGALPFERAAFEETIRHGGVGVEASLRAFAAAFEREDAAPAEASSRIDVAPPIPAAPAALVQEAEALAPEPARDIVRIGVERLVDYQDPDYARLYLARLAPVAEAEARHGDGSGRLLSATARLLALGMAYEDTIRVADLKIRDSRFARVRNEVRAKEDQVVEIAEFLHPRLQEIVESVPAPLGRFLQGNVLVRELVERLTRRGRVVRTTSVVGFLLLYAVASLRPWRRSSLRYAAEQASLEAWLERVLALAPRSYALAVELAECRTLVKGYGDTHARGTRSYEAILAHLDAVARGPDPAGTLAALREAALKDESGVALRSALAPIAPPALGAAAG